MKTSAVIFISVKRVCDVFSVSPLRVARSSFFVGIPFAVGPLIHKHLGLYCKYIQIHGLHIK